MKTKVCPDCGQELPEIAFEMRSSGNLRSECRGCHYKRTKTKIRQSLLKARPFRGRGSLRFRVYNDF